MKKQVIIAYLLAFAWIVPMQVSAEVSEDVQQDIHSVLDPLLEERQDAVSYGLKDGQSDYGDFSSFDTSQGIEIYVIGGTLGCGMEKGEFSKCLSKLRPTYQIPYSNSNGQGLLYLQRDENGKMEWLEGTNSQKAAFDLEDIRRQTARFNHVEELWLTQDQINCINLVFVVADGEEYVIPFSYGAVDVLNGAEPVLYYASDYFDPGQVRQDENFDPTADGSFGITPDVHLTPAFTDGSAADAPAESKMRLVLASGGFLAVGAGLALYVIHAKKKKD